VFGNASLAGSLRRVRSRLVGTTALVAVLYGGGYLLTIWRERIVATTYGAGRELDAFYVALGVATLVAAVPTRAISGPIVPCLASAGTQGRERQARLANTLLTVIALVLVGAALVLAVAAPAIVVLAAPGMTAAERASVAGLLQMLAPLVVGLGLYEILRALLNAYFDFVTPLLAPMANSVAIMVAVLLLAPRWGVAGLVVGVLGGVLLQAALPAIVWHWRHLRVRLSVAASNPDFVTLIRLAGWSALLVLIGQLTVTLDRIVGSYLDPGGITALNYAYKLVDATTAVVAVSASTVAFPSLSLQIAEKRYTTFWETCKRGSIGLALLAAPAALVLFFLAEPVVRLVFGGGRFDASATGLTAEALAAYSLALVPTAVCTYLATALYAMLRMRLLLGLAIFILVVKAILAILLLPPLAHQGVALSHGLSYLLATPLTVLALWWALRDQTRREAQP
jgi:putative peptidoglycan lipid II flippase